MRGRLPAPTLTLSSLWAPDNIYNTVSEKPGKLINTHFDNIILVILLIYTLHFFSFSIII